MTGIRALERADIGQVSALFELVMRSGREVADPRVTEYLTRVVLDDPWADPEIPSLVHEDADGAVVGFIAASTRRMCVDGRPLRMAVSSNLVAHPDHRSRGVGVLLNRALLAGPQDLTLADRANDDSRALWAGLGGQELVGSSLSWWRILRAGATAGVLAGRRRPALARAAQLAGSSLDAVVARLPKAGPPPPPDPAGTTEELTPEVLTEQVEQAKRLRLHPDYDVAWLAWAFAEVGRLTDRGRLTARLVRGTRGRVLGWFLYLLPPGGGVAEVLQVAATGDPGPVLDHLVRSAHDEGAGAVQGRVEPVTAGLIGAPGVLVRRGARALVAADDPALLGLLGSTSSLCSVLDGEWLVAHGARQ
jgi:GNAT superfamily N-acetyltransferase